ncbi:MAG: flavodoxin family protein [Candidatus Heimdallarchaeota archaeon]|nr:MAG: flavodoxin family protein [Candidatus Heimdallarchaeota archaeon]
MNILILLGARKRGNTHYTSLAIIQEMQKLGQVSPEFLFLRDYDLKFCLGCRTCFDKGELACPQKDDLSLIVEKIKKADGVIFASPVYVSDVSGEMKTLIDRLAYVTHRPAFFAKCSFIVTTTYSAGNKHARDTLGAATFAWGFHHAGSLGLKIPTVKGPPDLTKDQKRIKKAATKFFTAIEKQHFRSPSLLSLAVFKVQQRANSDPLHKETLDYRYWVNNGYSNPDQSFFVDVESSWMKRILASVLGRVILKIYS